MAQKVMYPGMVNSPETTITNGISESDTIIYVLDPARVPEPPNLMTLGTGTNAETIKVTEINDSAITVERGFQGIAKSWPAGTVIARNFTEYDYGALKDNIDDLDGRNIPVNKLDATVDPGVSDDSTKGYSPGSLWVNATGKKAFVCTDASTGAAVWEIYTGLGSHLSESVFGAGGAHGLEYEEGEWIPRLETRDTQPTGMTYETQIGRYTRKGNLVTIFYFIELSNKGEGGTGPLRIVGLPYTNNSIIPAAGFLGETRNISLVEGLSLTGLISSGDNHLQIRKSTEPEYSSQAVSHDDLTDTSRIIGQLSYLKG